jgi:hypothetical protein
VCISLDIMSYVLTLNHIIYLIHSTETAMGKKINAQLQSDSEYIKAIYRFDIFPQGRSVFSFPML